jgi:hypothetical protein
MQRPSRVLPFVLVCLIVDSGCGNRGTLQSILVHPSTADAKNYPGGRVAFSATGRYTGGSSRVGPVNSIQWCALDGPGECFDQNIKPGVTISQSGVAQCDSGSSGTWTIHADWPPVLEGAQPGALTGTSIAVGSATLTCP